MGHDLAMEQQQRDTDQRSFSGSDSSRKSSKTDNQPEDTPRGNWIRVRLRRAIVGCGERAEEDPVC